MELRSSLKAEGLDFPYWELVSGEDTNIHVAVLSKLPIVARRPHTNETFLLDGRRFHVSRGFAEVDIRAAPDFTFTLIAAHLKSRRPVPEADEAEQRLQEAKILRGIVDKDFAANPNAKLIVLGDFNDVKDSDSTKEIIGRGRFKLIDTRPAERNGAGASRRGLLRAGRRRRRRTGRGCATPPVAEVGATGAAGIPAPPVARVARPRGCGRPRRPPPASPPGRGWSS